MWRTRAQECEVYLVNLYLLNGVAFSEIHVTKAERLGDADILIGMSVITCGDFAVTNFKGRTKFSFRIPSLEHIDFVKDYKKEQRKNPTRRSNKKRKR